jgi:hypothetical protein
MIKLLQKYNEFIEELEVATGSLKGVFKQETFTREECEQLVTATAARFSIYGDIEAYEEAIEAIIGAKKYFLKKGGDL